MIGGARTAAELSGLYANPERDATLVRTVLANLGVMGAHEAVPLTCELRTLSSVLDEQGLARVDLLKIDVERAELDVLLGVEERDWSRIAQIACEVHGEGGRMASITAMLEDRGFAVTTDQDQSMRGTEVRMLYAIRR